MLTKIIFTIAVIALVMLVAGRGGAGRRSQPARGASAQGAPKRRWIRYLLLSIVLIMLTAGGGLLYENWSEGRELMRIRVIDSASGRVQEYSAYRGDIGERAFQTTNGRLVQLATGDRLELEEVEQ